MTDPDYPAWQVWRDQLENELIARGILPVTKIEQYTDDELLRIATASDLHVKHFKEGK